jgi:hypothetical protein
MRFFIVLLIFSFRLAWSYTDPELDRLWNSLSDITNPTLEDYRIIESYLRNADRPYLDRLRTTWESYHPSGCGCLNGRLEQRRNFKLVGPNGEAPVFEIHKMNVTEKTKDRCILIYASYNGSYPTKLRNIVEELREREFSGTVMIRIGGFPNLSKGGLQFCPFFGVWKNEFIKEALRMGFTKILHLDTSIHPLTNLDSVFESIENTGYYLLYSNEGSCPYLGHHQHLTYLKRDGNSIPWLPGFIIGLNFTHPKIAALFDEWDYATKDFDHFNYFGSEEVIMTILAWQKGLSPTAYFGHRVLYGTTEIPPNTAPTHCDFYFDASR